MLCLGSGLNRMPCHDELSVVTLIEPRVKIAITFNSNFMTSFSNLLSGYRAYI